METIRKAHTTITRALSGRSTLFKTIATVILGMFVLNTLISALLTPLIGGSVGALIWQTLWCAVWVYLLTRVWARPVRAPELDRPYAGVWEPGDSARF